MIKQTLNYYLARWTRQAFGIHLSYREAYRQDYLQSPRWKLLSAARKMYDGHRCTYHTGLWQRCTAVHRLQAHHTTYKHRGAAGIGGLLNEFNSLRTLCDYHHAKTHGKVE